MNVLQRLPREPPSEGCRAKPEAGRCAPWCLCGKRWVFHHLEVSSISSKIVAIIKKKKLQFFPDYRIPIFPVLLEVKIWTGFCCAVSRRCSHWGSLLCESSWWLAASLEVMSAVPRCYWSVKLGDCWNNMRTQNPNTRPACNAYATPRGFQLESYLSQGGTPFQRGLCRQRARKMLWRPLPMECKCSFTLVKVNMMLECRQQCACHNTAKPDPSVIRVCPACSVVAQYLLPVSASCLWEQLRCWSLPDKICILTVVPLKRPGENTACYCPLYHLI